MQLDFKNDNGTPVKTAIVKAGGGETETLPLYTNKDTITGEVGCPAALLFITNVLWSVKRYNQTCIANASVMPQKSPQHKALASHVQVKVANIPGKKLEHQGIKVQLIGSIELATERGHPHDFVSLGKPLFLTRGQGSLCVGACTNPYQAISWF